MPTQSGIRLIGAFFAGIVLALGAALIYTRTTSMIHPEQTVAVKTPVETSQQTAAPATSPDAGPMESEAVPPIRGGSVLEPSPTHSKAIKNPQKKRVESSTGHERMLAARNNVLSRPPAAAATQPDVPTQVKTATIPDPYLPANPVPDARPAATQMAQAEPVPAPRTPMTVTLEAGTVIPIRLSEKLSTEENYSGDTFRAVLDQPLILNGFIIADKGSKVLGRIVDVRRAGRVEGVADLTLALTQLHTTDGQNVRIETNTLLRQGSTSRQRDAAEIGGGAALGAIIGAIAGGGKGAAIGAGAGGAAGTGVALGTRGKPAVVPVETHLTFKLQNPVTITEKLS